MKKEISNKEWREERKEEEIVDSSGGISNGRERGGEGGKQITAVR